MTKLIPAVLLVVLALLHSGLGEWLLVGPLLKAPLPAWRIGRFLGARTLRFAWHLTSIAWVTLAAALLWPARLQALVAVAMGASGVVAFVASRGRHFAWPVFVVGGLVASGLLTEPVAAGLATGLLGCIAVLHLAWALGLGWGRGAVVPSVDQRPVFQPGRLMTLGAAATFALGAVVAWKASSGGLWQWLAAAGAVACAMRTLGDVRFVGLFKRVRRSAFAEWDDLLFTPVSFVLAVCFAVTAW